MGFPCPRESVGLPKTLPPCVDVRVHPEPPQTDAEEPTIVQHQNGAALPFQDSDIFKLTLRYGRQLCSGNDVRPAYELTFSQSAVGGADGVSPAMAKLMPGTALGVLCPNVSDDVERTLKLLALRGTERLSIGPNEADPKSKARFERFFAYVPRQCTSRHLLTHVLDLRTVLKKAFVKVLGDCCPEGSADRLQLHAWSSVDQQGYRCDVLESRMMIFDLLERFPDCRPSLAILIEYLARLSPRFYSVANYSPNEVKLIYRPMEFMSQKRTLRGQCSTMFARLQLAKPPSAPSSSSSDDDGDDIGRRIEELSLLDTISHSKRDTWTTTYCYLRKNIRNFGFPTGPSTPVVFVSHGTGIAPFLAYVDWLQANPNARPDEVWLFYGCRYVDRDALFDLEAILQSGCRVVICQSRQDITSRTVGDECVYRGYVQDGLVQHAEDVRRVLLESGGELLICGDFQTMAKDTLSTLRDILHADTVDDLLKNNRIKLDVWT